MTDWNACIAAIHDSPHVAVLCVTGGGVQAASDLLLVPGATRTVLDVQIPYSAAALTDWLGRAPEQYCSEQTALAMASVAYHRARQLADDAQCDKPLIGLACTAALVSDRPKRGDHRAFVAIQTAATTSAAQLTLAKGLRNRQQEDRFVSELVLRQLASACEVSGVPAYAGGCATGETGDLLTVEKATAAPLLAKLWSGEISSLWSLPGGEFSETAPVHVGGILAGSFNPIHGGHQRLRKVAEEKLGTPIVFEMTVTNADKPPLDFLTIERRRAQFSDCSLLLTNAQTFVEKARVFPGCWFVVGVDTAERILQPRFYGGDEAATIAVLNELGQLGCRFLVAGRLVGGKFENLNNLSLPTEFRDLFIPLSESEFREDTSSTSLRRQARQDQSNE